MFSSIDIGVLRFLNGPAGRAVGSDAIVVFGATHLIFVMAAIALGYAAVAWRTPHFEGRVENVAHACWAGIIGYLAQAAIGFLWFRPRPFVAVEDVVKLVDRLPTEKSFPSAHATLAFAIAFAIAFHNRKWGGVLLALAGCVALARVAAGVHYPSDAFGGMLVGLAAAVLAAPIKKVIEPYLDLFAVFRNSSRRRL